jgi:hypothetical protein
MLYQSVTFGHGCLLGHCISVALFMIKKRDDTLPVIILISLLVLVLTRITLLSLIDVTSWQIHPLAYLHPLHPLFLVFIFIAANESVRTFQVILNRRRKELTLWII